MALTFCTCIMTFFHIFGYTVRISRNTVRFVLNTVQIELNTVQINSFTSERNFSEVNQVFYKEIPIQNSHRNLFSRDFVAIFIRQLLLYVLSYFINPYSCLN